MSIIISNSLYFHQKYGGVTRYSINLFKNIIKINSDINTVAPIYKNIFLKNIISKKKSGLYIKKYPNINFLKSINNFFLKKIFLKESIKTIHHCYYPDFIIKNHKKKILTIHDLIHEKYKETYKEKNFQLRKKIIDSMDAIICVSNSTKNNLIEEYKVPNSKIKVIYHGGDHFNEVTEDKNSYKFLNKPFLLYVGSRKKYKNFSILLNVFRHSKKIYNDFNIVCFGTEKINQNEISLFSLKNKIFFVNGDDSLLKKLYLNSVALICTSNDEGFCLPILEAMSLGCPVIGPNLDSLKEVYKDNIFYFERNNLESLIFSMENNLYSKNSTIDKTTTALKYSKNFTWKKNSSQTLEYYS